MTCHPALAYACTLPPRLHSCFLLLIIMPNRIDQKSTTFPYMARLKESYKSTIGVNLFTQVRPVGRSWDSFKSPHELLASHNLKGQPGLFIIASQQRIIGGTCRMTYDKYHEDSFEELALPKKPIPAPGPNPVLNPVPIGKTSLGDGDDDESTVNIELVPNVIGTSHTQLTTIVDPERAPSTSPIRRNAISIVTMALGVKSGTPDVNNTEILHYSGGDVGRPAVSYVHKTSPCVLIECRLSGMSKAESQDGSSKVDGMLATRTPAAVPR